MIALKVLARLNKSWALVELEDGTILPALVEYWPCPVHGEQLVLHDFTAVRDVRGFCHVDVHAKCPLCDYYATFGVNLPCSDDLLRRLQRSPLHGRVLRRREELELWIRVEKELGVYEYPEDVQREVIERLEKWGYW